MTKPDATMKIVQEEQGFTVKDSLGNYKFWKSEEDKAKGIPMYVETYSECLNYCHAANLYPHKDTGILLGFNN